VSTNFVALQLEKVGQATDNQSEADVLRRTLAVAFRTLSDVLASGDTGTLSEVISAVERCRAETEAGAAAHVLDPLAKACFESIKNTAAHARNRAAEQRAQVAEVVAMVRETVATLAGDQASLHDSLTGSAERFERLAHVDDLQKIQAQLVKEVATLKRVTIERRAAWDQTVQEFGTRLNTLESQLDRTRREAATDPLTNIANRRVFERTCREWLGPNRPGFVMAMIDVDDFKAINDRHGHAVGDRVLAAVAETLSRSLRSDDLVARLGGDEFAILAACLTLSQAEGRCASIGRAVQNACHPLVGDGPAPSISIGVTECAAGDTFESLQQRADAALYDAKRNGKGRVASKASPFIRDLWKTR
jgi:diguanylate cyclase (GGDEF)-like protein